MDEFLKEKQRRIKEFLEREEKERKQELAKEEITKLEIPSVDQMEQLTTGEKSNLRKQIF